MNLIVSCPDHRRRVAEVEVKPTSQPVAGEVIIEGKKVAGRVIPAENLEYQFYPTC